jgi:hypothetical protein
MVLASGGSGAVTALLLIYILVIVVEISSWWRIFAKAGRPGWGAVIPIYNVYLMCKIAGRPGWWLVLYLIPFVNIVISAIVAIDLAKSFRQGTGFGIGLWILSFIFAPILGFGSSTYSGPAAIM